MDSVKNINKLSRIHFDIALGDYVPNSIIKNVMPSILDYTEPLNWQVYFPEQIFSEKLQTAVVRGITNSRGKDIYDMVKLFDRVKTTELNAEYIPKIFALRKTALPASFYNLFNSLNTLVLENSWRTVDVVNKPDFLSLWGNFLEVAKKLDSLMNSNES